MFGKFRSAFDYLHFLKLIVETPYGEFPISCALLLVVNFSPAVISYVAVNIELWMGSMETN